jgi:hypothetical protein
VPGPSNKYEPCGFAAAQAAIALFSEATDVLEETGTAIPACALVQADRVGGVQGLGVVSPSGKVAGSPAFDQSMARLGERILDQG